MPVRTAWRCTASAPADSLQYLYTFYQTRKPTWGALLSRCCSFVVTVLLSTAIIAVANRSYCMYQGCVTSVPNRSLVLQHRVSLCAACAHDTIPSFVVPVAHPLASGKLGTACSNYQVLLITYRTNFTFARLFSTFKSDMMTTRAPNHSTKYTQWQVSRRHPRGTKVNLSNSWQQ